MVSLKFAIMGTGGVGGVFGARLAAAGEDVSFIARGAHLDAIRQNGLKLTSEKRGNLLIKPELVTDKPGEIGPVDVVFLTVKLWDTEAAAQAIKPLIDEKTAVVSLQNGIEKDVVLRREFGAKHVVGGVSYVAATIESPGVIAQRGDTQRLVFGEYDRSKSERLIALKAACEKSDLEAELSLDIEKALWEKFVFLVAMSAVLSATRQTIGPIRSNPLTRQLLIEVMSEAIAVGRASGVELDDEVSERRMQYCDALAPDVIASMLYDLQSGNRLELPWLSGYVVQLGRKLNVPTPANQVLVSVLSPYVNGSN